MAEKPYKRKFLVKAPIVGDDGAKFWSVCGIAFEDSAGEKTTIKLTTLPVSPNEGTRYTFILFEDKANGG